MKKPASQAARAKEIPEDWSDSEGYEPGAISSAELARESADKACREESLSRKKATVLLFEAAAEAGLKQERNFGLVMAFRMRGFDEFENDGMTVSLVDVELWVQGPDGTDGPLIPAATLGDEPAAEACERLADALDPWALEIERMKNMVDPKPFWSRVPLATFARHLPNHIMGNELARAWLAERELAALEKTANSGKRGGHAGLRL